MGSGERLTRWPEDGVWMRMAADRLRLCSHTDCPDHRQMADRRRSAMLQSDWGSIFPSPPSMSSDPFSDQETVKKVGPIRKFFRTTNYYKWNVILPCLSAFFIWADYSHTQEWKAKKRALEQDSQ